MVQRVLAGSPGQLVGARQDPAVQLPNLVTEEAPLFLVEGPDNLNPYS